MESILVIGISIAAAVLNLADVIVSKIKQPADTIFLGIPHWYEDYFYYLAHVAQGASGSWLSRQPFTTEAIPASILWWYNILLGKIAAITTLSPWLVYDASIFLMSVVYLLLSYRVLISIFPQDKFLRIGAFLIFLTSISPVTYFYAYTSAFNRLGGVSHLIAQNILSLALVWMYTSSRTLLWILIFTALIIINPVYAAVDLLVFFTVALILQSKKLFFRCLLALAATLPILLVQLQTFSHPFYQAFRTWETGFTPVPMLTFLLSTGLISIPVLFGLRTFLQNRSPLRVTGLVFAFLPILLYFSPLPKLLQLPVFRILQPPAYVFLGGIAITGIRRVKGGLILLCIYLLLQIPPLAEEFYQKTHRYYLDSPINYLSKNIYQGLLTLKEQPRTSYVLATGNLEFIVPVVSGFTVYSAHRTLTWHYDRKAAEVFTFYSGNMDEASARRFLSRNNIGYVLWKTADGPSRLLDQYPFLTILYQNPSLFIYNFLATTPMLSPIER